MIKLEGRNFDTTEVIEEESQAMLNTLTDHIRGCIYKWQKRWKECISEEGEYFEDDEQ
jgi:hypothetical protein